MPRVVGAFLLWTLIAVVFATQLYFAGLSWPQALAWALPRWYSWGLVAPGIFALDRRLAATTSFATRVMLHVPLAALWTTNGTTARLFVHGDAQPSLIVNDLKLGDSTGAVALWIGPGTEGYFAGLTVHRE